MVLLDEAAVDAVEWLKSMLALKRFGSISLEVKFHDGRVVAVEKSDCVHYQKSGACKNPQ